MTYKSISTSQSTLDTINASDKQVWFSRQEEVVTGGYSGPLLVTIVQRDVPPTKRRNNRRQRREGANTETPEYVQNLLAAQQKLQRAGASLSESAVCLAHLAVFWSQEDRRAAWEQARQVQAWAMKTHQDASRDQRKLERTASNESNSSSGKKSLMNMLGFRRRQTNRIREPVVGPLPVY